MALTSGRVATLPQSYLVVPKEEPGATLAHAPPPVVSPLANITAVRGAVFNDQVHVRAVEADIVGFQVVDGAQVILRLFKHGAGALLADLEVLRLV